MKLKIHLLDDNRLIAAPDNGESGLNHSQWQRLTEELEIWNGSGRVLVCPIECEIIDMRTPQREQIEVIVGDILARHDKSMMDAIVEGIVDAR